MERATCPAHDSETEQTAKDEHYMAMVIYQQSLKCYIYRFRQQELQS